MTGKVSLAQDSCDNDDRSLWEEVAWTKNKTCQKVSHGDYSL